MNFWKRAKHGVLAFLAGILLFKDAQALPHENVLDFVSSLPKEEQVIDYKNLEFILKEKGYGYFENNNPESKIKAAYQSPFKLWDYGKNKIRYSSFDWHGVKVEKKVDGYYDKKNEEVGLIGATIAKETIKDYEKLFDFKLKKQANIFFYNGLKIRETNFYPGFLPASVGAFWESVRRVIVVPWKNNELFKHLIKHELSHTFLHGKIFEEEQEIWKFPGLKGIEDIPKILPTWVDEGVAEAVSNDFEVRKETKEVLTDLALSNSLLNVYDFPYSYAMYRGGESFFCWLINRHGKEKIQELCENWYDFYRDFDDEVETENFFGNKIIRKKMNANKVTRYLASEKRILNYAFEKTFNKSLGELNEEWKEEVSLGAFNELEKRDKLEDIAVRITPEMISGFPVFNGKTLAYLTSNKSKTNLAIKIIKDSYDSCDKQKGKERYKIIELSAGRDKIESFSSLDYRMDINHDFLVFSALKGERYKLFFFNLHNEKLEEKSFNNLLEISNPSISSDGKFVVFSGKDEQGYNDIYLYNKEKNKLERLTNDIYNEIGFDFKEDSYDFVFSTDKTLNGKKDLCVMKNFKDIEKIISSEFDDQKPRFTPSGNIIFISDRNGIDNLFLVDKTGGIYQLTNLITPIKDVFCAESKKNEEKVLVTYYQNLSYNVADIQVEKCNVLPVPVPEKIAEEKEEVWQYKKDDLEKKEFKNATNIEQIFTGATNNGYFIGTYFSDYMRDEYLIPLFFFDFKNPENTDFFFTYLNLNNRINYSLSTNRTIYSDPEKWSSRKDTSSVEEDELDDNEIMHTMGVGFSLLYPLNFNERFSASISMINSDKNSKEFFGESWQKFWIFEEKFPHFDKGMRFLFNFGYTNDYIAYGYRGPLEGTGYKFNLGTKVNPEDRKISSISGNYDFRSYKKLGNFGVAGLHAGVGYGHGEEFEKFGIGDVWTIKGYGKNRMGTVPEFYGDGYWLCNASISQIPLIKSVEFPWTKYYGADGQVYFNIGNSFDKVNEQGKPKMSVGMGISTHVLVPMNFYFSHTLNGKSSGPKFQFYVGYNFD